MNAQMFGETIDTEVSVGYVPTLLRGNDINELPSLVVWMFRNVDLGTIKKLIPSLSQIMA